MDWINIDYFYIGMLNNANFWIGTLIFSMIAYMIGSINAGQLLSLMTDKKLENKGSGNFGATNAGRLSGPKWFVVVFVFDLLKAIFCALILTTILTKGTFKPVEDETYLFYYASIPIAMIFLVIGHSWPIYFDFKGGKGVAVAFGSIIFLNWNFGLI